MILEKENIGDLPHFIAFYHKEHKQLTILFLEKLAQALAFKLKIQKSSIQLLNPQPFAVIGLRKNQKQIFIEFYNETAIDNNRIINTIKGKNEYIINRVNIFDDRGIDSELIAFIIHSNDLIS